MNVAFRGTGETGNWFEDQQAAALQSGDVSEFGYRLDVAKLTGGATEPAVVGPATTNASIHERLHESPSTAAAASSTTRAAEGVNYDGIPRPRHFGRRRRVRAGVPLRRQEPAVRDLRAERAHAARPAARAARLQREPHEA
jgi:hypothetical protein